jgi:hypothetical protein
MFWADRFCLVQTKVCLLLKALVLAFKIEENARLFPLSTRRYTQINYIADLGKVISRSGKYDVISIHDISSMQKFQKRTKFETETRLKKMKETKGCYFYNISNLS